jgi:hypothetical protein
MEDPIQRYRKKSSDRHRQSRRNSLRSIERLQQEVYKTKQTISSADDHQGEMHQSLHSRGRLSRRKDANGKTQPRSKSRGYRVCPFDADGYCTSHPDVRLAKMKAGGWKVLNEKCHKCLHRQNTPSTESFTSDSCHEESHRRREKQNQRDARRRSSSRGRHRETHHRDEHKTLQRSRSGSKSISSRSKSLCRRVKQLTPKRTVCVNGVPFDKSGRCFVHNHIKLASKKLLGGWKVHYQFCPECAKDDGNEENCSVISGISGISLGSFASGYDDHSVASSAYHSRGDASVRSSRSCKSIGSQRSWSSKQSRKRMNKTDDSFLPLDEDGYCLHHPEVKLAESRKGTWNVLLDFCPGKSLLDGIIFSSVFANRFAHNIPFSSSPCRVRGGHSHHWRTFAEAAEAVALFKPFLSIVLWYFC